MTKRDEILDRLKDEIIALILSDETFTDALLTELEVMVGNGAYIYSNSLRGNPLDVTFCLDYCKGKSFSLTSNIGDDLIDIWEDVKDSPEHREKGIQTIKALRELADKLEKILQ